LNSSPSDWTSLYWRREYLIQAQVALTKDRIAGSVCLSLSSLVILWSGSGKNRKKLRFSPGALNLIFPKTIRLEDYTEKGSTNYYGNCHGQIPGDSLTGIDKSVYRKQSSSTGHYREGDVGTDQPLEAMIILDNRIALSAIAEACSDRG
jgi:hypothetical protein